MERASGAMTLATVVTEEPIVVGGTVTLGEETAHHLRVRRIDVGARIGLLDGAGVRGAGTLVQIGKRVAAVHVESAEEVEPPSPIHLILPVADKDRMLMLAEKCTELAIASWRPVVYRRSKSVNPRGEGTVFQQKVRARMVGALEQSRGAWLPVSYPDATVETAIAAAPDGVKLVLEAGAPALMKLLPQALEIARAEQPLVPVTIAIGPEGGFEPSELEALMAGGFTAVSLGSTILRFETAAIAGIAAVRAALEAGEER